MADITKGSIGEFRDIIRYNNGKTVVTDWKRNTIVNGLAKLVSIMLKGDNGYGGIKYWAIGSGSDSWDNNPHSPSASDEGCTNEIYRKAIPSNAIKYLDDNFEETSNKTNRLLISLTFNNDEGNGTWREFAIVGGNATDQANSGIAINHKITGRFDKTSDMKIERQIRFTFR